MKIHLKFLDLEHLIKVNLAMNEAIINYVTNLFLLNDEKCKIKSLFLFKTFRV